MDPKVTNMASRPPLARTDRLGKSLWNVVFHSRVEYSTHCITQWPGAHGRLRGELAGVWATSKCLKHNVCFSKPSPHWPAIFSGNRIQKITTGMLLQRTRAIMSEGCVFRDSSLQRCLNFPHYFPKDRMRMALTAKQALSRQSWNKILTLAERATARLRSNSSTYISCFSLGDASHNQSGRLDIRAPQC